MSQRVAVNPPSWTFRILVVSVVATAVLGGGFYGFSGTEGTGDALIFALGGLSLLSVGSLLVLRVPANRVSWVLLAVALGIGLMSAFEGGASSELGETLGAIALFGLVLPGLGVFVPLWFPTGDTHSAGWRWVAWVGGAGVVGIVAGWAVVILVEAGDSDIDGCTSIGTCASVIGLVLVLGAVVAAIGSLVVRWVKSEGEERLQMKWLVPAFFVFGLGIFAEFGGFQGSLAANILLPAGLILVPVAIGLAILRYRLYDIDRIVSRTVSYTVLVVLLVAVYAGGVTGLTSLLPDQSQLVVAATTLAVAALFNPVRKRVQVWVDRRFNRSRYDAQRVMDRFAGSLRDRVDTEEVVDGWVGVVSETMQPTAVAVWVRKR
ncbi:MAG: hypothetical protein WED83_00230 [Acidimicrobiia bacterium]